VKKKRSLRKTASFSLVFVAIVGSVFALGIAVGQGDLKLGRGLSPVEQNQSLPENLDYLSVDAVYDTLKSNFDGKIDAQKLLEGLKRGLVDATGDPYTEYFNPKEAKAFSEALSGTFIGIGAELGTNSENQVVIVSPLSGFPAERAGLRPKDVIAAVDGLSTSGLSVDSVVRKIRGDAGTEVVLTIVRDGGKPFELSITRAKIDLPSVKHEITDNIGYLRINQFNEDTAELTRQAAEEFKAKAVVGVILDVRGNPGGYLSGAVSVSSLWLPEGTTVVSERRGKQVVETERSSGSSPLRGIPTVVLIDAGSASASEITAGALRDHGAATLVGVKSFGKGSVQQVQELSGGGQLKVTIARWYTPAGNNIDKEGISPDVEVKLSEADIKAANDRQKSRAIEIIKSKLSIKLNF